jgi:hypothetical protein
MHTTFYSQNLRPTRIWEKNIKIYLKEIDCEGLDLTVSGYGPVAASSEHGNEPSGSIKDGEFFSVELLKDSTPCNNTFFV